MFAVARRFDFRSTRWTGLRAISTSSSPPSASSSSTTSAPTATSSAAPSSRDSQSLTLPDGRLLGYAEYGANSGFPLVYFHGFPSSRLEGSLFDALGKRRNIRVIAPDRPGFGISSPQPGRTIRDWPGDVAALVSHLGLERFSILGVSGGGPYALACALPGALGDASGGPPAVGVLAGAPPWDAPGARAHMARYRRAMARMAQYTPTGFGLLASSIIGTARWTVGREAVIKRIDAWLETYPDATKTTEQRRKDLIRMALDAYTQGSGGLVQETRLLTLPWGIAFDEISQPVKIWHGVKDTASPIEPVRWMADRIPGVVFKEFDDAGHYDVDKHFETVLEGMAPSSTGQ
ncbi:hypothetical protein DXG03_001136 [Asterophora parasitica]|uniref:AB hydrolase-1 domain-containing protein n=1 Tax=Asterophora parasitica TaxID=117018 RepID=A0A9P7GAS3_9AGAR|nr:hypothetical protein DXG03_001136 [Asterophora parasitica]